MTLWIAVTSFAILAVAGFVIDGGAKIRAGSGQTSWPVRRPGPPATPPDRTTPPVPRPPPPLHAGSSVAPGSAARWPSSAPDGSGSTCKPAAVGPMSGITYTVTRDATAQLLIGVTTGEAP